jgi:hypothetical protein
MEEDNNNNSQLDNNIDILEVFQPQNLVMISNILKFKTLINRWATRIRKE